MRTQFFTTATLLVACTGPRGDAGPKPARPDPQRECLADEVDHATAQAVAMDAIDAEELGSPASGPLRTMGAEPTPLDLDGDGRPEIDVTFEGLLGAYSRDHWLYTKTDGCTRFLGRFEEAYLWPGTARHAGMLDLLVLLPTGELDEVSEGGGTMTRLVFDGTRYEPDGSVVCPRVTRDVPRDTRCPGAWGDRGAWIETGAWDDGATPSSAHACISPAADAAAQFGSTKLVGGKITDIDGDGAPDFAYGSEEFAGTVGSEVEVYVSNHGCARDVGRITVLDEPVWNADSGELQGGWVEQPVGSCRAGEVGNVLVYYRLDATGLVESRRTRCPCEGGPAECR